MIAVQSLWTGVTGFKLTRASAMIFSASVAYVGRAMPNNELVTDIKGLKIADRLRWKFTTFTQALECFAPATHRHVWMLGKIKALQIQMHACAHIDLDLLPYSQIPERVLSARVAAQSKDSNAYYWQEDVAEYMEDCGVPQDTCAFNTAITVWNDISLKDEYCRAVNHVVNATAPNHRNGTVLSIVAEQGVFGKLMRDRRVCVEECIPLPDHASVKAGDFEDFKFSHHWGRSKANPDWNAVLEERFKRDFPKEHSNFERGFECLLRDKLAVA